MAAYDDRADLKSGTLRDNVRAIVTTVDLQEFQECVSDLVDRAQQGGLITITKHGQPVARLISAELPTRPGETIRPGDGSRYLPTPIKLRGSGPSAASYISENRR